MHDVTPPDSHVVCPGEHVLQLAHAALPADPAQSSPAGQLPADATNRQPFASVAHVSTLVELVQRPPLVVHAEASQVHETGPPEAVHVWCVPHAVVVTQAVHPLACVSHICTLLPEHCVSPAVQASVQHEADPALPAHAPSEHVCEFVS